MKTFDLWAIKESDLNDLVDVYYVVTGREPCWDEPSWCFSHSEFSNLTGIAFENGEKKKLLRFTVEEITNEYCDSWSGDLRADIHVHLASLRRMWGSVRFTESIFG